MKDSPNLQSLKKTSLKQLNKKTAHYIEAAQAIPGISACVKELIENSIDAGATSVSIKLLEYGKKGLIVSDNGHGIDSSDYENITKKHATSKISTYDDLEVVSSFGFRGEALASICAMSDVTLVTKTEQDTLATQLTFDDHGHIIEKTKLARATGTMISLENMFKHFPVRQKHQLKNYKKEYLKCLSTIQSYALISENIRITSYNVTKMGKNPTTDISTRGKSMKDNIIRVFGSKNFQKLESISFQNQSYLVSGYISLPKQNFGRSSSDRQFVYFHKRPVDIPSVNKIINEQYRKMVLKRYPVFIINIEVSNAKYDVNLNPDKKAIFIQEQQQLYDYIEEQFQKHWEKVTSTYDFNSSVTPFSPSTSSFDEFKNASISSPISTPTQSSIRAFGLSQPSQEVKPKRSLKTSTIFDYGFKTVESKKEKTPYTENFSQVRQRIHDDEDLGKATKKIKLQKHNDKDQPIIREEHNSCSCSGSEEDDEGLIEDEVVIEDSKMVDSNTINNEVVQMNNNIVEDQLNEIIEDDTSQMYRKDHLHHTKYDNSINAESILQYYQTYSSGSTKKKATTNTEKNFIADLDPNAGSLAEAELSRSITKDDFMRMKVIGQFNKGFIIAQLDDDLFILDQHACDEIYNFETLQQSTILNRQPLIQPIPLELPAVDEHLIMDNLKVFEKSGFSFKINKNAPVSQRVYLKTVPHSKNAVFDERDVSEMIFMLHENEAPSKIRPSKIRAMFASRACRKSVMIGTTLSKQHMKKIVNHMNIIDNPWQCPHGRPTMRHLFNISDQQKN